MSNSKPLIELYRHPGSGVIKDVETATLINVYTIRFSNRVRNSLKSFTISKNKYKVEDKHDNDVKLAFSYEKNN